MSQRRLFLPRRPNSINQKKHLRNTVFRLPQAILLYMGNTPLHTPSKQHLRIQHIPPSTILLQRTSQRNHILHTSEKTLQRHKNSTLLNSSMELRIRLHMAIPLHRTTVKIQRIPPLPTKSSIPSRMLFRSIRLPHLHRRTHTR